MERRLDLNGSWLVASQIEITFGYSHLCVRKVLSLHDGSTVARSGQDDVEMVVEILSDISDGRDSSGECALRDN